MNRDFIYLASASPRRAALLSQIGIDFQVFPANIPEQPGSDEPPDGFVTRIASEKAAAVFDALHRRGEVRPVLGADTAVVVDDRILGKPEDREHALAMLKGLSGRTHEVFTAIALRDRNVSECCITRNKVRFRATTAREREAYCLTQEPFDKAGGYGIQGLGAVFIEYLEGSYSAVMGLPLFETSQLLERYQIPDWLFAAEHKR